MLKKTTPTFPSLGESGFVSGFPGFSAFAPVEAAKPGASDPGVKHPISAGAGRTRATFSVKKISGSEVCQPKRPHLSQGTSHSTNGVCIQHNVLFMFFYCA
jgi:hypothetical protein